MAKPKKTPRPKAVTPKGFRDYFGTEVTHRAEMLRTIAGVYHRYGFDALFAQADASRALVTCKDGAWSNSDPATRPTDHKFHYQVLRGCAAEVELRQRLLWVVGK